MLTLKNTCGFRIISVLKLRVSAIFLNAESWVVPDSRRFLSTESSWELVSACRIYLETWRMYSFRNWNLLKHDFALRKSCRSIVLVHLASQFLNSKYISIFHTQDQLVYFPKNIYSCEKVHTKIHAYIQYTRLYLDGSPYLIVAEKTIKKIIRHSYCTWIVCWKEEEVYCSWKYTIQPLFEYWNNIFVDLSYFMCSYI